MTVLLDITADDVIHSWWIPKLGGKIDAVPGYTNKTWFQIPPSVPEGQKQVVYDGPVRRAVRPQPRQHVRPRDRHADGGLQEVVRGEGPGGQGRPGPRSRSSRRPFWPNRPKASNQQDLTRTDLAATTEPTSTGLRARPRPQIIAHRAEREATAAGPRGSPRPITRRSGSCTSPRCWCSSCSAGSRPC